MVKICVFDTETNKLPIIPGKDWNERSKNDDKLLDFKYFNNAGSIWNEVLPNYPSILQLSYVVYDIDQPSECLIYNKYIDIPDTIIISEESQAVHHINKEFINNLPLDKKSSISNAIFEFLNIIMDPEIKYIVGHNVQFDQKIIIAELLRLKEKNVDDENIINKYLEFMTDKEKFACTMILTKNICNIPLEIKYKDKKTGEEKIFFKVKSPKLIESYFHYFGYEPKSEALHDAIIDVILCLRVFMKYKFNIDICGTNEVITDYIKKISPEGYVCPKDITEEINTIIMEKIDFENEKENNITIISDDNTKGKLGGSKKKKYSKKRKLTRTKRNKKNSKKI